MHAGTVFIMPATVTLFSPPPPHSITPFPSPKMLNTGSSLEERFLVYDVSISAEQKGMGSMALPRPTAEKSVILFYSCGTISFFLKSYYFHTIKVS